MVTSNNYVHPICDAIIIMFLMRPSYRFLYNVLRRHTHFSGIIQNIPFIYVLLHNLENISLVLVKWYDKLIEVFGQ